MDDPKWLRLVTIGLVLAALAVGYFLLSGKFSLDNQKAKNQISKVTPSATPTVQPSPASTATPSSAYNRIANRMQAGDRSAQSLPNTGFPAGLAATISLSVIIAGWGLRKFPH